MRKLKWIWIWAGLKLLKRGLKYRITGEQEQWLQPIPKAGLQNREECILNYCAGKKVLHVGFADAPYTKEKIQNKTLLHTKLKQHTTDLLGVDTDVESVELYKQLTNDEQVLAISPVELNNEQLQQYDIILIGEVLEHLPDPVAMIEQLYPKMKGGQLLMITVPNHVSFDSMAGALYETESIHPDHHWYFSPYTLLRKFPEKKWEQVLFSYGLYGNHQPNFIQKQFPATGDCLIAVFKKKA